MCILYNCCRKQRFFFLPYYLTLFILCSIKANDYKYNDKCITFPFRSLLHLYSALAN